MCGITGFIDFNKSSSEEMISINDLAKLVIKISDKNLELKNIPKPQGVRGRKSDNKRKVKLSDISKIGRWSSKNI